ncbi:MAG: right-handed parallel beta-helix repeat-containing protein [Promethearchaeota archaeon]
MKIQKKALKISLILTALTLSIILPIITVTAKKPEWTSGPVYINDDIPGFTWSDWSVQPWLKGSGTEEDPYVIKDLVIEVDETIFAMLIENSSAHFKIMKCKFSNGGIEGGRTAGLILINTQNGIIFKNQFIGNGGAGIAVIGSLNITIRKNLCSENGVGIYVEWGMYTTIKQNDCKNNLDSGIVIASAHRNIIEKNDCVENANAGIALINVGAPEHSPKSNIIYANNLENNLYGIILSDADINDILRNTIAENTYGILAAAGSEENIVYHNNIIDNVVQAVDFQPLTNNWYHPYMLEGNFWAVAPFGYDLYPIMEESGWEVMTPIEEEISDPLLPNRLGGDRFVNPNETSYIRYGVLQLFSERVEGEAYPPYAVRINGEEVLDSVWIFQEETVYEEPGLMQLYYMKIPPYYLTEVMGLTPGGYYEYDVEISWYDCGEQTVYGFTTGFTLI